MPIIAVEECVPYDKSRMWALQDAYFTARGLDAWTEGDIPFGATSNAVIAKQHVAYLAKMLPGDQPVTVLEIGSGNGAFAKHFLLALDGRGGKSLRKRLVYVMTDVWAENLKGIAEQPLFAHYVKTGQLVLATYDVRVPDRIVALDGTLLQQRPNVVIANYLACVTATKIFHKSPLGWLERYSQLGYEPPEGSTVTTAEAAWDALVAKAGQKDSGKHLTTTWQPVDPIAVLGPELGNTAIDVLAELPEGTIAVPYAFLEIVGKLVREWGAHALITDFGRPDYDELRGASPHDPVMYGGCMSHPVDFPLFEHWGHHTKIDVLRTIDPLRMVHVVALRPMEEEQLPFVKVFRAIYGNRDAEAFFDLMNSARDAYEAQDWTRAARLASRGLDYDPLAVELYWRFGNALINAGYPAHAVHSLRTGKKIQGKDGPFDFDLALGRAYMDARDFPRAHKAFKASLKREDSAITWVDLARLYDRMHDSAQRDKAMKRAEKAAPGTAYVAAWSAYFEDKSAGPPA